MENRDSDTATELLERERNRLARDIHDGPAQSLTNTSMRLEVVKRLLMSNRSEDAIKELERLQGMLRNSINDVRRMIFDLRPALLEHGVKRAIYTYAERYQQAFGIEATVQGDWPEVVSLTTTQQISLFRIVQELLNNVHKHAQASEVRILFYFTDDRVGVCVRDNGVGFDMAAPKTHSFGFQGMSERAALIGGTLNVQSAPGEGTCVECEVPAGNG